MKIDRKSLAKACRRHGLSLRSALVSAGVSPNAYFSLQRKDEILPKSLVLLARSLGVSAEALVSRETRLPKNVPVGVARAIRGLRVFAGTHKGFLLWFGSRVREEDTPATSDWDVGHLGVRPAPLEAFAQAKAQAQESAWPHRLDFVDLNRAPREFIRAIEDDLIPLEGEWEGENEKAASAAAERVEGDSAKKLG